MPQEVPSQRQKSIKDPEQKRYSEALSPNPLAVLKQIMFLLYYAHCGNTNPLSYIFPK